MRYTKPVNVKFNGKSIGKDIPYMGQARTFLGRMLSIFSDDPIGKMWNQRLSDGTVIRAYIPATGMLPIIMIDSPVTHVAPEEEEDIIEYVYFRDRSRVYTGGEQGNFPGTTISTTQNLWRVRCSTGEVERVFRNVDPSSSGAGGGWAKFPSASIAIYKSTYYYQPLTQAINSPSELYDNGSIYHSPVGSPLEDDATSPEEKTTINFPGMLYLVNSLGIFSKSLLRFTSTGYSLFKPRFRRHSLPSEEVEPTRIIDTPGGGYDDSGYPKWGVGRDSYVWEFYSTSSGLYHNGFIDYNTGVFRATSPVIPNEETFSLKPHTAEFMYDDITTAISYYAPLQLKLEDSAGSVILNKSLAGAGGSSYVRIGGVLSSKDRLFVILFHKWNSVFSPDEPLFQAYPDWPPEGPRAWYDYGGEVKDHANMNEEDWPPTSHYNLAGISYTGELQPYQPLILAYSLSRVRDKEGTLLSYTVSGDPLYSFRLPRVLGEEKDVPTYIQGRLDSYNEEVSPSKLI